MDKEKIISLENLNQYSEETSGKIKEKISEHTSNGDVHVTTTDKSNWNGYASKIEQNKTDIQNLQVQDGVLNSRIDNIATLPEGSTTADAELADIRVGADGNTYPNAGTAVRAQVSELKSEIGDIVIISDNKNLVDWKSVKLATYLETNGIETSNENHWCTDFFEVEPNTTYCLGMTATLGDVYWANCCQYDSNKTFISGTNVSNAHTVTTNENAKYIRFGRRYENASGSGSAAEITVDNYLTADYTINKTQFQKGTVPTKIIDDVLNPCIKVTTDNMSEETLTKIRTNDYWYRGKYILTYGDSIVEQKKWQDYVKNYFGCTAVYNNGIGGTCVANNGKTATLWNGQVINGWMCGDDRIDLARRNYGLTQAVILLGGHNDFASNIPLGDLDSLDDTKFKSAYALMIKKMIGIFPNAKIFAMTPANSRLSSNATNMDTEVKNSLGLTMSDYADAVKEVCSVYGIPVIDIFGESGMSVLNGSEFVTDTVHLNDVGGKRIANAVINGLKRFEPIDL